MFAAKQVMSFLIHKIPELTSKVLLLHNSLTYVVFKCLIEERYTTNYEDDGIGMFNCGLFDTVNGIDKGSAK